MKYSLRTLKEAVRPFYLRWLYFNLFPSRHPEHFQQSWEYPAFTDLPAKTEDPDVLFLPMTDWHTRIQRTQHLARAFAALGHRCFYLNPHLGREFPRTYPFTSSPQFRMLEDRIVEAHVHLPLEPVFHDRMLNREERRAIIDTLSDLFARAGTQTAVQILSLPVWLEVALELRERFQFPIVYDCHDVLSGFHNIAREIVEAEAALFDKSDLVLFSARNLMNENIQRKPAITGKSLLVRNAVDQSWLETSEPMPRGREDDITIGYMGALDFWFDIEAIAHAAAERPQWRFVLIGRVEDERILSLRRYRNVEFTGEVPHSDLHGYVSKFRVALIPFVRNELTLGTNPIKVYEYFSYGLPVVSARLPEMEEFGRLVYLYEGREGFVNALDSACAEHDSGLEQDRIRVAHQENWNARAEQLRNAFQVLRISRLGSSPVSHL